MFRQTSVLRNPKLFGIGLYRTGTSSLFAALHELGYTTRFEWGSALAEAIVQTEAVPEVDRVCDGVVGFCAWCWRTLDRRYQGSRFILTVRDEEAWLGSMMRLCARRGDYLAREVREFTFGTAAFEPERLRAVYRRHERDVRAHFADRPEDLLVMDIAGGDQWEPLCAFLDRPVPDQPFPHKSRSDAWRWSQRYREELRRLQSQAAAGVQG